MDTRNTLGNHTMSTRKITEAIQRIEAVLQRKPEFGLHDDAPATAAWKDGTRFVASHPNGLQVATDMPTEFGGTGDQVTPGWLFRAGLASCAATSILLAAAKAGIELASLEVKAGSRSDTRGLLGLPGADGQPVYGGPGDVTLSVRIAADGIVPARLHALVEAGVRQSPVPNVVTSATVLALHIDTGGA
jgi:uncharacterized OsmC-like protein